MKFTSIIRSSLLALLLAVTSTLPVYAQIDWSGISYVPCDAGCPSEYVNSFKVSLDAGQNLGAIQNFYGQGWGIYTSFGSGINSISGVSSYRIEGAGVCLHCSSFTDIETEVTVVCALQTYHFTVYNANGAPTIQPLTVPDDPNDLNDCEVFPLFGLSTFANKGLTEFQFWDGSGGSRSFRTIDGKEVCYVHGQSSGKYAIMSNTYDVSAYDKFHVDLWTPNSGNVHIRLMGYSGGWQEATNYLEYAATGEQWLSIDANVSDFTFANPSAAISNMKGLMIIDLSSGMQDYHVANMYFYKSTSDDACYADCGIDVALNKHTWSGCSEGANTSDKAVDGTDAMWQTGGNQSYDNQWWIVDLGRYYELDKIGITFENARTKHMLIQTRKDEPTAAEMADNDAWETIVNVSGANDDGTGTILGNFNLNEYTFSGGEKARYIRFKSEENTYGNAYGCKIRMFKVCVTGLAPTSGTPPTMATADFISYNPGGTGAIVELTATDLEESAVTRFRVNEVGGSATTVNTDVNHRAVLEGLTCGSHTYHVYAVDSAGNVSVNYVALSFCFSPTTYNIARNATTTAGHSEGGNAATTAYAVDGDMSTHWYSYDATAGTNEWFTVDLGKMFDINQIKVRWGLVAGNDDGSDYPIQYTFQVSSDNTNWSSFAQFTNKAATGDYQTIACTDPLPGRYVRIWVDQHDIYSMGIRELEIYPKNTCYEADGRPVITMAEVTSVSPSSVDVHCESWAEGKTHDQIRYYYELYKDESLVAAAAGTKTHTSGNFSFDDLDRGASYSAKIWAEIISSGVRSLNYKEINFSVTYSSLHYLTEETACNWTDGLNHTAWQFKYTDNTAPTELDGGGNHLQILEYVDHTIAEDVATTPPSIQYKLHETAFGGIWTSGANLFFRNPRGKALKMYALGTEKFVSNLDELYVSGNAVGGWWTASTAPNAASDVYRMTYNPSTGLYSWTGDVYPNSDREFKIVIRNMRSANPAEDTWAYDRIMATNKTYDRAWTRATLYFDMSTWTWWWEKAMTGGCERRGGPGSGSSDQDGQKFTVGYKFDTYNDGTNLIIEGESFDPEAQNNAILQIYRGTGVGVEEINAYNTYHTYTIGTQTYRYFQFIISLSDGRLTGNAVDGVVRYCVKFEGNGGVIRVTESHYYHIATRDCEPDYFDIYHWDDAPDGARTSFAGGTISQPIRYFRHFEHSDWCTLSLPFTVSKVVVDEDGTEYPLYPRFNNGIEDVEGYYWLKTIPGTVSVDEFKASWQQLTVSTNESEDAALAGLVKPAKNTPYAIAFPDGSYYGSNWVIFYGASGQTIDSDFSGQSSIALPSGNEFDLVQLQTNNTMHASGSMSNIYMLDEGDDLFRRRTSAVPAFECYVVGTHSVQRTRSVLSMRERYTDPTDIDVTRPTTLCQGEVYNLIGQPVGRFASREQMEQLTADLPAGVYILRTQTGVKKIQIR